MMTVSRYGLRLGVAAFAAFVSLAGPHAAGVAVADPADDMTDRGGGSPAATRVVAPEAHRNSGVLRASLRPTARPAAAVPVAAASLRRASTAVTSERAASAQQVMTTAAIRVDRFFDNALRRISGLPCGPVNDLLSGALLLARRVLVPELGVSPALGLNFSTALADPAPTYSQAVTVVNGLGVTRVRMYDIVPEALTQIQTQIPAAKVSVAIPNSLVSQLASDPSYATTVLATLAPYGSMVDTIVVGNEVDGGCCGPPNPLPTVQQAVANMQAAITTAGVPIATTVSFTMTMIANSYPPSNSTLNSNLTGLLPLLQQLTSFVEIDIYPLNDIQNDPADISLNYALGNARSTPVNDNGVIYHSLFWAEYDAVRWALNKAGITIPLHVGETGWATNSTGAVSPYSTVTNAQTYNQNVIDSNATTGSPKFGVTGVPLYLFEFIDENQKTGGIFEPYWGWYSVSGTAGSVTLGQKYSLNLGTVLSRRV